MCVMIMIHSEIRRWGLDFSKKGGVDKIGGCFAKGGGTPSLIFIVTNLFQSYLLCFTYLHHIYHYSVSWKEPSLPESNQQMCGFCKSVIFKKTFRTQ